MIGTKPIGDNVDDLNKLLLDIEKIGIKIEDEDKAILIVKHDPLLWM